LRLLHDALRVYHATDDGPLRDIVGHGTALPDGSAVYGVVIHTTGPAVADFGACPILKARAEKKMVSGVSMANVNIHDLQVDVLQVTRLMVDGTQVMGPAGDVFDWRMNTDAEDKYVGNLLSDAQLAVGAYKKYLHEQVGVDLAALKWYFGAVHIPDSILSWAASGHPWSGTREFKCNGDSMSHINKGAVGLFLGYLQYESCKFKNVSISGLSNLGKVDSSDKRCVVEAEPEIRTSRVACEWRRHGTHRDCTMTRRGTCYGKVKYGHGDKWTEWREMFGDFDCSNGEFGDPNRGQAKECICEEDVVVARDKKCWENGFRWTPLDMAGARRSVSQTVKGCQERCASTTGCKHFSFWHDGGCHLQDGRAQRHDHHAVSGPPSCV